MAAYDNVSLPAPPNIATAGNYAQMLMQGLSQLPQEYQRGQDFQYQQQQRNLFKDGVPTNPQTGQPDLSAILQKLIRSGGAPAAQANVGLLQKQPFLDQLQQDQARGGTPQQPNTSPTGQTAAALDKASTRAGGGQPSATDNAGAESVRTLTAGIANGRPVQDTAMANYARAIGVSDPDAPLSPDQEARARKIIGNNLGGVSGQSPPPATNDAASGGGPPINAASANQGNELPAVGGGGGQAISPAPTAAAGAIQPSGPQVAQAPPAGGGAAGMVPPAWRNNPLGYADVLDKRAEAERKRAKLKSVVGIPSKAEEDQAADWSAQAKAIREQLGEAGKATPEMKNVASGTEERKGQIAADTKYYDSLHRGLAGSGMIAAQQKQNVDLLRQVAASPSFTPGAGSELAQGYQRLAAQFGINPTAAAPREIFNQVAARILADQFSGMKSMAAETGESGGRLFKSMLDIEEKANITPQDTLEGIKAKLDIIDRTGDLMMRWADKADDYKIKHGRLDAGFDKELRADIAKARVKNAVPQAAGAGAPDVGHVEQGYRFKGGDHRDKNNWVPVSSGGR